MKSITLRSSLQTIIRVETRPRLVKPALIRNLSHIQDPTQHLQIRQGLHQWTKDVWDAKEMLKVIKHRLTHRKLSWHKNYTKNQREDDRHVLSHLLEAASRSTKHDINKIIERLTLIWASRTTWSKVRQVSKDSVIVKPASASRSIINTWTRCMVRVLSSNLLTRESLLRSARKGSRLAASTITYPFSKPS